MKLVGLVCCLTCLLVVWQVRSMVRGTSLIAAWNWALLAITGMTTLAVARFLPSADAHLESHLPDYLIATLLLTPLVSVLGARMPAGRAWSVFVVLPLVVVLCWPAFSEAWNMRTLSPVNLGTPAALGFLLVLLMAFGNYFGSGNTGAAILYAAAIVIRMWPITGWPSPVSVGWHLRILFTDGLPVAAACLGYFRILNLQNMPVSSQAQAANRLWLIFRDLFGIVWAKRVMDRMNLFASREQWNILLTLDGFTEPSPPHGPDSASQEKKLQNALDSSEHPTKRQRQASEINTTLQRPVTVLCWLLTRFAGESWLSTWTAQFFSSEKCDLRDPI